MLLNYKTHDNLIYVYVDNFFFFTFLLYILCIYF